MITAAVDPGTRVEDRVLVAAIPAFNEQASIETVVRRVCEALPALDLLVVVGSSDDTEAILRRLGIQTASHLCNLGYGHAIQTAIKYARRKG